MHTHTRTQIYIYVTSSYIHIQILYYYYYIFIFIYIIILYMHARAHKHIYVCLIIWFKGISTFDGSSSSCCAISTDISDSSSPPFSIVHYFRQVFRTTPSIGTELLYVGSRWSFWFCSSMWRGPQEYVAYEFILTSQAMSRMSGSSTFDSFRDGWKVAAQLLLCRVLPPELVQYSSQQSCAIAVKLFSLRFVIIHVVHPYTSIDTTAAWKKLRFILSVRPEIYMNDSLSLAVHTFACRVLMSVSVDATLLPW